MKLEDIFRPATPEDLANRNPVIFFAEKAGKELKRLGYNIYRYSSMDGGIDFVVRVPPMDFLVGMLMIRPTESTYNKLVVVMRTKTSSDKEFLVNATDSLPKDLLNDLTTSPVEETYKNRVLDTKENLFEAIDKKKLGKCYALSGRWILDHPDYTLVHGTITRKDGYTIKHAWTEKDTMVGKYPMVMVYDPVLDMELPWDAYERMLGAKVEKKYSAENMGKTMVKAKHWGPWLEEDIFIPANTKEVEKRKSEMYVWQVKAEIELDVTSVDRGFDSEEKAISFAKNLWKSGKYFSVQVEEYNKIDVDEDSVTIFYRDTHTSRPNQIDEDIFKPASEDDVIQRKKNKTTQDRITLRQKIQRAKEIGLQLRSIFSPDKAGLYATHYNIEWQLRMGIKEAEDLLKGTTNQELTFQEFVQVDLENDISELSRCIKAAENWIRDLRGDKNELNLSENKF